MTKVISISDQAYGELSGIKNTGESFSGVILRVVQKEKRKSLLDFFGKWPGSKTELDSIKKELEAARRTFKTRDVAF
ncbi:antitoxin VapB family protein [Candidatus Woesearchaeota archaeon]|nr:antitoxin VapB family protein [Candidatus Woesearchaeota archaeon]